MALTKAATNVTLVLVFKNEDSVLASTCVDADHYVTWLRWAER